MYNGGKSHDVSASASKPLSGLRGMGAPADDAEELGSAQVEALLAQVPESVQILEDLFQAFEIDPQLARELGAAAIDLAEAELEGEDNRPTPRENRALLNELADLRTRMSQGLH